MNDQYEQLLWKMYISNALLLLQLQFQKSRKPKAAKLAELVNQDFMLNFDRYMQEINNSKTPMMAAGVTQSDIAELISSQRSALAEAAQS